MDNILSLTSSIVMALVTGSLFYDLEPTTNYVFRRVGALFYPILLMGLNTMSEVQATYSGRPIIARHKRLAFARPAAHAMACAIMDIPLIMGLFSIFEVVFYFMVHFQFEAAKFFTNWFVLVVTILCLTSLFRAIGAWNRHFGVASQITGVVIMIMMTYAGYLIPTPNMHPWVSTS